MGRYENMGQRHKGFTLLELLLVTAITSLLILGMNAAYRQAHLVWSQIEDHRATYNLLRILSETLRTELSGVYLPPTEAGKPTDDAGGSFRLEQTSDGTVELAFFTLTPAWRETVVSSRIAKVRYRFTPDDVGLGLLERYEQPCAGAKIIGQEIHAVLAAGLSALQLWAVDPNDPRERFKLNYVSTHYPPRAIKAVMTWPGSNETPESSFEMLIHIPCEESLDIGSPGDV